MVFRRRTSAGQREGLGLELHIYSQIVNALHGKLEVISSPDLGTRFTATLPLDLSAADEARLN